jgi:hypothetical protein
VQAELFVFFPIPLHLLPVILPKNAHDFFCFVSPYEISFDAHTLTALSYTRRVGSAKITFSEAEVINGI